MWAEPQSSRLIPTQPAAAQRATRCAPATRSKASPLARRSHCLARRRLGAMAAAPQGHSFEGGQGYRRPSRRMNKVPPVTSQVEEPQCHLHSRRTQCRHRGASQRPTGAPVPWCALAMLQGSPPMRRWRQQLRWQPSWPKPRHRRCRRRQAGALARSSSCPRAPSAPPPPPCVHLRAGSNKGMVRMPQGHRRGWGRRPRVCPVRRGA